MTTPTTYGVPLVAVLDPGRTELTIRAGDTVVLRVRAPSITVIDLNAITDWLMTLEQRPCPATT